MSQHSQFADLIAVSLVAKVCADEDKQKLRDLFAALLVRWCDKGGDIEQGAAKSLAPILEREIRALDGRPRKFHLVRPALFLLAVHAGNPKQAQALWDECSEQERCYLSRVLHDIPRALYAELEPEIHALLYRAIGLSPFHMLVTRDAEKIARFLACLSAAEIARCFKENFGHPGGYIPHADPDAVYEIASRVFAGRSDFDRATSTVLLWDFLARTYQANTFSPFQTLGAYINAARNSALSAEMNDTVSYVGTLAKVMLDAYPLAQMLPTTNDPRAWEDAFAAIGGVISLCEDERDAGLLHKLVRELGEFKGRDRRADLFARVASGEVIPEEAWRSAPFLKGLSIANALRHKDASAWREEVIRQMGYPEILRAPLNDLIADFPRAVFELLSSACTSPHWVVPYEHMLRLNLQPVLDAYPSWAGLTPDQRAVLLVYVLISNEGKVRTAALEKAFQGLSQRGVDRVIVLVTNLLPKIYASAAYARVAAPKPYDSIYLAVREKLDWIAVKCNATVRMRDENIEHYLEKDAPFDLDKHKDKSSSAAAWIRWFAPDPFALDPGDVRSRLMWVAYLDRATRESLMLKLPARTALWFGVAYGSEMLKPLTGKLKEVDLSALSRGERVALERLLGTAAPLDPHVESELRLEMSHIVNHAGYRFIQSKLEEPYLPHSLDGALAGDSLSRVTTALLEESRAAVRRGHLPGAITLMPRITPRRSESAASEGAAREGKLLRR